MTTLSLERVCPDVKFTLPNVVKKQKSKAFKAVFVALYHQTDTAGITELDAQSIANSIGFCRQQVYRAIRFLERVNLLEFVAHRTGRGIHSIIKLNWRKSVTSPHPYKVNNPKTNSVVRQRRNPSPFNQKAKAFRELMSHSFLLPTEQAFCVAVLLRYINPRPTEEARKIYDALVQLIGRIDVPSWVETKRDLARWWMGVVKGLMSRNEVTASEV